MSFETSMIYTMGMALTRALDSNTAVDVLVNGQWLSGTVVISDGYGVVLDNGSEHAIVKVEQIAAVRVRSSVPDRPAVESQHVDFADAVPMPGPRVARTA